MLKISFQPFPELQSERLFLRRTIKTDVQEVFDLRSDAETMKYIPRPLAKNHQDVLEFIDVLDEGIASNTMINWAIEWKESSKLIGMVCLIRIQPENHRSEIGYLLHPEFHGKGIMHEAVNSLIDYAFDGLKFHSLEAVIDPDNFKSEQVLLKHGFIKEAHFKENFFYEGRFLDCVIYSLLKSNWTSKT
jgi:ribosomal-protein-alanine N-acetyltransferase